MSINEYIHVILGVVTDIRVIATVIVCILVIEFAKFITTYRKRPPKPKVKKVKTEEPKQEEKKEESSEQETE